LGAFSLTFVKAVMDDDNIFIILSIREFFALQVPQPEVRICQKRPVIFAKSPEKETRSVKLPV